MYLKCLRSSCLRKKTEDLLEHNAPGTNVIGEKQEEDKEEEEEEEEEEKKKKEEEEEE